MSGFWSKLWGRWASAGAPPLGTVEGFIGRKLGDLEGKHDFFRFFNFESAGVEKTYEDGDVVLAFKPSGPAFRDLVTLRSWVKGRGRVVQTIRLTVQRSFIDDPETCVHAADLYNSFLRSVGEVRESDAIDAFAREITARSMQRSARPVLMRGAPPQAAGEVSQAYRAYAGELEAANITYGSKRLRLVARNGNDEFEILVWAMDAEERGKA